MTTAGDIVTLGTEVEIGKVTMNWNWDETKVPAEPAPWVWVAFLNTYNQPRVVAKAVTFNGSDPLADPRIKWKTGEEWPHTNATGFYVRLQEWDYRDGNHTTESFSYIVVESATAGGEKRGVIDVTMDDATTWRFIADNDEQIVNTTECGGKDYESVRWDVALPDKPIVFTGVSSWDDSGDTNALVTRNRNVTTTSVEVTIQEQKLNGGATGCTHDTNERIHAIAVVPPGGASTTIAAATYKGTPIQAGVHASVNSSWKTITYDSGSGVAFTAQPLFIGDMQTINATDPCSIRVGGKNQTNDDTAIQLKIEEESSDGTGTGHTGEEVGWLAAGTAGMFKIRVGVQTEPTGILQNISGSMRIGMAVYNYNHNKNPTSIYKKNKVHGGTFYPAYPDMSKPADERTNYDVKLSCGVHDDVENIYRVIEEHPLIWGTTPIAEVLYEIKQYIKQESSYYDDKSTLATFPRGKGTVDIDPYYYGDAVDGETLECAETFVLHFNDGSPFKDWDNGSWTNTPKSHPAIAGDGDGTVGLNEMLDDVAYSMRKEDLRDDLSGHQDAISYYVYAALGEGEQYNKSTRKMREAAVNGGFIDYDGDHEPDVAHPADINDYIQTGLATGNPSPLTEWDEGGDYNPDTFYYANNGYELVQELMAAFMSILERTSSGTAASVISNSRSGEGALYQSIFYPVFKKGTQSVKWTGQVHAMFVDAYGNIREDTDQDGALSQADDRFIVFDGETVYKYKDTNANGLLDDSEKVSAEPPGKIMDINFLWSSSDWLNTMTDPTEQRTYNSTDQKRHIFTFVDSDNDMVPDTGEVMDFKCDYKPSWTEVVYRKNLYAQIHTHNPFNPPFVYDTDITSNNFEDMVQKQTQRVINFTRGEDQPTLDVETKAGTKTLPAFRSREIDYNGDGTMDTWRLGDIVNSTPTLVGRPAENYDLIYRDSSYSAFYMKYKNRRNVIYVGANDGMFHAFNGGFFDSHNNAYLTQPLDSNGDPDPAYTNYQLGAELWAYVPQNLLPHLFWLTDADYPHVFYCDMKPKIFDAKIFTESDLHPNGWGTILVAGMRFGGGKIATDTDKSDGKYDPDEDRTMSSAYFIFDITNPESAPT
ncbi:MAG: PilC/PilY family type IV pilus protein, partial [Gammaproteobacteria bacterium]